MIPSNSTSFLDLEIRNLKASEENVRLVTYEGTGISNRGVPIVEVPVSYSNWTIMKHFSSRFRQLALLFLRDLSYQGVPSKYLKNWRTNFKILLIASINADMLESRGIFNGNAINYTYFMNEFALMLALARKRGYTNSFFGRGHGRDVIDGREDSGRLPFQWLKYQYVNSVFAVSKATQLYIQGRYPKFSSKIDVSYLGIEGHEYKVPKFNNAVPTIVSVGRVRNIKRYYLIAEALLKLDIKIKWIHIGGVSESDPTTPRFYEALENLKSVKNIEVDLRGELTNEDVFQFYRDTPIDVIVSVSEDEGLPVSMMEAISFGVPILATDVGGNSEIVTEKTGKLIPKDFSHEQFTNNLNDLLTNYSRDQEVRKEIRLFWEENFESEKNFRQFLEKIHTL